MRKISLYFDVGILALCWVLIAALLGVVAGAMIANSLKWDDFWLDSFGIELLIIFVVFAPIFFRPKDLIRRMLLSTIFAVWGITVTYSQVVETGQGEFLRHILAGKNLSPLEVSSIWLSAIAIVFISWSFLNSKFTEGITLKIYVPLWKKKFPLIYSVLRGQHEDLSDNGWVAQAFLQRDSTYYRTPLHWAAMMGDLKATEILLARNPEAAKIADADHFSPLHVVLKHGKNEDLIRLILLHGAPLFNQGGWRISVVDLVINWRDEHILKLILSARPDALATIQQQVEASDWIEGKKLFGLAGK